MYYNFSDDEDLKKQQEKQEEERRKFAEEEIEKEKKKFRKKAKEDAARKDFTKVFTGFGATDYETDKEQSTRETRERIIFGIMVGSFVLSIITFFLASTEIIHGAWFMLFLVIFLLILAFYNWLGDQKIKMQKAIREDENRIQLKFVDQEIEELDDYTDWILFRICSCFSLIFIFKAFQVIEWWLFILLGILAIMVIILYVWLKKNLK